MSDPKEQEKLTPSSGKSYDGSRTPMADNNEIENAGEPHDEDDEEKTRKEKEAKKKEKEGRSSQESQSKLIGVLRALFSVNEETTPEQKDSIAGAFVNFVKKDAEQGDNVQVESAKNLAQLLFILPKRNEERTPHTSDEDLAEISASHDLYEAIFEAAEGAGLDSDMISEELAILEAHEPPIEAEDRFDKLDQYFKERTDDASKAALLTLQEGLTALAQATDETSVVHEPAEEAASTLEDIIEEVEESHNDSDDLDAQERAFDKSFAEVIVRVFETVSKASLKDHAPTEGTSITDKEEQEASQLMDILLSPKDSKAKKRQLFAAMLESIEGKSEQEAMAIRQKLIRYAEHEGLKDDEIANEREKIRDKFPMAQPAGNGLEEVPVLNAFEQIVQQQITKATSKEVQAIQKGWKTLLETAEPKSKMEEMALDAIDVLGKIIDLKKMQEARDRGETVNPHLLEPPGGRKEGAEEEQEDPRAVETKKKIKTLEESISAIKNEEMQAYVHKLIAKIKKGMTPEEVAAEEKALKQKMKTLIVSESRARGKENERTSELIKAMGPFNKFLLTAKEGIVATKPAEGESANEENIEAGSSDITSLEEILERVDDSKTQEYLRGLLEQIQQGMTVKQMNLALKELNAKAHEVSESRRGELNDADKTNFMQNKAFMLIAYEANINNFRKFLVKKINSVPVEEGEQDVPDIQQRKARNLVSEIEDINNLETFESLRVENLESYIANLSDVLRFRGALTDEQLRSAYISLLTQGTILRQDLLRKNKLIEATELFEKIEQAQIDLYAHLVRAYGDDIQEVEDETHTTVTDKSLAHANRIGDKFYLRPTGAHNPVDEGVDDRRGLHVRIDDAVEQLQNVNPDSILPGGEPPEGFEQPEYDQVKQKIGQLRHKQVYTNEKALEDIQNEITRLQQRLMERYDADRTQAQPFGNMSEARALVQSIAEQRRALAALSRYKGTLDRRSELDTALYEGFIHEALGERMRRIRVHFGQEQARPDDQQHSDDEIIAYYKELKKWAKIVLDNDIRNNPDKIMEKDVLRLSTGRYRRYQEIVDANITNVGPNGERILNRDEMLRSIDYLLTFNNPAGGDFLRYFMKNVPHPEGPREIPGDRGGRTYTPENPDPYNPENLLGVWYQRPEEMQEGYGVPEAVKETMSLIAEKYSTKTHDFRTGGNRELMDAEGNFKYNNFYYWIRVQVNADIDYNKDGQINPFGKITIKLPLGSISLYELLLLIPEYLSQRNFEVKAHEGKSNEINGGWGEKTEHPNFKWLDVQYIAAEMEFRQLSHDTRVKFVSTSKSGDNKTFLALMHELHDSNHWTRAENILLWMGMPSSVVNGTQEIDDWINSKKEKAGSLGKALSDMMLGYYYLPEVTDFYKKPNGVEKTFNENMFYKFWEPNGANKFLLTMAEKSLCENNQAKAHYARFIQKRIQAAAQVYYERPNLSAEQRQKIQQLMQVQSNKLTELANAGNATIGIDVSFTSSEHLTDFFELVDSEVFGNRTPSPDRAAIIARKVRDDLVKNLKNEYFRELYDMQIGDVGKQSSEHYLMVKGTNTFGNIDLGGGTTMRAFLEEFDPAQITAFDYKNKFWNDGEFGSDPLEVRRRQLGRELTPEESRAALDDFMAAGNRNHDLFKRNEKMMLAFTKHLARMDRKEINHLRDADESETGRDMVRESFRRCVEMTYGIDSVESEYAWTWARDYVYIWGIAAMNDVTGIGFRADGKLFRTGPWRARRGGKDGGGNKETYDEFLAVSLPFLHALRVVDKEGYQPLGHQSVFSLLQGGDGGKITPRAIRDFGRRSRYTMALNSEEQYVTNTLTSAVELVELLSQTEFDFSGILRTSTLGQVTFDYEKARELFKKWRKPIRYALEKNHLDYREVIWANGRETDLYHHFFGKKTRAINELIKQQTGRSIEDLFKKPADAVMMTIIAAEIAEHRAMFTHGHHWSIQNIMELERFLIYIMTEDSVEQNAEGIDVHKHGHHLITEDIFRSSLAMYNFSYYNMYSSELGTTFFSGLFLGLIAGFKEYWKNTSIRI